MSDYELTHPLYLDVQMMRSFLGFLDGGVSLTDEQVQKSSTANDAEGHGSASVKTPGWLPLLGAELGAGGNLAKKLENSTEYRAERHRTESSLFNRLYGRLHYEGKIQRVESVDSLKGIQTGRLVEMSGRYNGNPIGEILELANQFYSYTRGGEAGNKPEEHVPAEPGGAAGADKDEFGIRLMLQMNQDMINSPVRDLLITTFSGLKAVLTVASEYFPATTREFLRESEIKVLGKLTRSLAPEDHINLMRRTIMGIAGEGFANKLVTEFMRTPTIQFEAAEPIVRGPAVQILPMAIFV